MPSAQPGQNEGGSSAKRFCSRACAKALYKVYSLAADGEQPHGAQRPLEHCPRHYPAVKPVEVAQRRGEAEPAPVDLGSDLPGENREAEQKRT